MDCVNNICPVAVDDEDTEIMQDNKMLTLDAGRRDEIDDNEPKSLIMEIYPWIQQFKKMCRSSLFQPSMTSLKHLMMYYTRNVRLSVNDCYTKPLRAEKVKDSVSETLLFFLYYYRVIGENHDRTSYMELLTDLLAMYIDMELKASKKGTEQTSKISARLSSCLHVYLEQSAEHLLDTLLKVHFMTHNYHEILDPVITKIFKGIQEHPNSSIMYVRYFLVYRLWKKLNKNVAVRNQINVSALASLGSAPNDLPSFFIESVQPKVPNTQKITTKLFLTNKFDVDKCRDEFFKFCKRDGESNVTKPDERTCSENAQPLSVLEDNDTRVSIVHNNVENVSNEHRVKSSSPDSSNNDIESHEKNVLISKSSNIPKSSSLRKLKKSNDIVIIDLTSDSVTEKVIRQKKTRRKPVWLENAKKRAITTTTTTTVESNKIDATTEDAEFTVQQLEDTMNFDSLCIENSRSEDTTDMETIHPEDTSTEERTSHEDSTTQIHTEMSELTTTEKSDQSITKEIEFDENSDKNSHPNDDDHTTISANTKNSNEETPNVEISSPVPETTTNIPNPITEDLEITTNSDPTKTDEFFIDDPTLNDKTESPNPNTFQIRDNEISQTFSTIKSENNKIDESHVKPMLMAIKCERVTDENDEIINAIMVSRDAQSSSPQTNCTLSFEIDRNDETQRITECTTKIRESEFQENIDGLSLLASVSQRVSHLTTTSTPPLARIQPVNVEQIKVKNYALLANLNSLEESIVVEDSSSSRLCNANEMEIVNRIPDIYTEDAMDKVAYQVEVTSSGETNSYDNECDTETPGIVGFHTTAEEMSRVNQPPITNSVNLDNAIVPDKDDNKVILNGETVVLFQKSPNSNLYIINKAVENRDHVNDDVANGMRDIVEHTNENAGFTYEFPYENVYRNQSAIPYDLTQYNRDVTSQDVRRVKKIVVGVDSTLETNKIVDAVELSKLGKNMLTTMDVNVNRKNSSNATLNRRRHIKQEYNGCGNDMSGHITPNYVMKECSQEHADANLSSMHNSVTHANPLSSIYTTYNGPTDIYLPCHKNFNSMTCGIPVCSKTTTTSKTHCTCLNCNYGIVAHCGDCIIPTNENLTSAIDKNSYYLPMHSNVQTNVVQDCPTKDSMSKMFDEKLVCKLEQTMMKDDKILDNVKCETKNIYRSEIDNKLPLKKRFSAMMSVSFGEPAIKREKTQSYPGTPMLSIAAIDSRDSSNAEFTENTNGTNENSSLDLSMQDRCSNNGSSHHASEMIRRDYRKDAMMMMPPGPATSNGHRNRNNGVSSININGNGNVERKRKRKTVSNNAFMSSNVDEMRHESVNTKISKTTVKHKDGMIIGIDNATKRFTTSGNKSQARPSEKVTDGDSVTMKNSSRQTRSSKRNLPKVNYIYTDGDSDWNPSAGEFKRKRKRTSR